MALLPSSTPKAKETHIISDQEKLSFFKMEEMMMVMMKIRSHEPPSPNTNTTAPPPHNLNIPIITNTISPTWKLYENPFYISHHHHHQQQQQQLQDSAAALDQKQIHRLHLPISARKIAASFWDLTFIKPFMESELESARAQINELKSDLDSERKARKKMESLNKRLARELSEERRGREALERLCEELAKEISSDKSEISRMRREIDDERKMMRTAEVIREERVQMKLADAKILLEQKFSELEMSKKSGHESSSSSKKFLENSFGEKLRFVLGEKAADEGDGNAMALLKRTETENPHIKRGIKGFVEFPKVVRAIGCRSSKHLGSKLECQKAQLKILLKQKGPVRFNGLIAR